MSPKHLAALALAGTALAAAGCGSSTKDSTTTAATVATTAASTTAPATKNLVAAGTPLSRAQLIAAGDKICAHANALHAANLIKSNAQFVPAFLQAAAYDRAEFNELQQLVPPTAMAKAWQQVLVDLQTAAQDTTTVVGYVQKKETKSARSFYDALTAARQKAAKIAHHYGFIACSRT